MRNLNRVMGERYYVAFALCHHKSVCRLSVCCLWHWWN